MAFSIIDFFIFLNIYGVYIVPVIAVATIMYVIRYFAFPLLTRGPMELVVIFGPQRVKFYKVTQKFKPMFETKKGAYWFGKGGEVTIRNPSAKPKGAPKNDPIGDWLRRKKGIVIEKPKEQEPYQQVELSKNRVHVYHQSVDQEINEIEPKIKTKISDVMAHYAAIKQIASHAVQIPPSRLSFNRNWILTIDKDNNYWLEPTKLKQPLKVNFFVRMGIVYTGQKTTVAAESTNPHARQQTVTLQVIEQKVGDIEKNLNYSASFMLDNIKMQRFMVTKWYRKLLAIIDWRPVLIIIGAMAAIVAIFLLSGNLNMAALGPPPEGCTTC